MGGRTGERRLACKHLVEHTSQGIDVAPRVRRIPHCLLRAHIRGRSQSQARLGESLAPGQVQRPGDAEIGYNGALAFEQDVLRLDVSVDDALPVGVSEGVRHLLGEVQCAVHAQLNLPPQAIPERLSMDVGHGVPELACCLAGVEDWKNVRVLQAGGESDLAEKALGAQCRRELGMENFEGDQPVVSEITGAVDRGHAATPEFLLEHVAIKEGLGQRWDYCGHGTAR